MRIRNPFRGATGVLAISLALLFTSPGAATAAPLKEDLKPGKTYSVTENPPASEDTDSVRTETHAHQGDAGPHPHASETTTPKDSVTTQAHSWSCTIYTSNPYWAVGYRASLTSYGGQFCSGDYGQQKSKVCLRQWFPHDGYGTLNDHWHRVACSSSSWTYGDWTESSTLGHCRWTDRSRTFDTEVIGSALGGAATEKDNSANVSRYCGFAHP